MEEATPPAASTARGHSDLRSRVLRRMVLPSLTDSCSQVQTISLCVRACGHVCEECSASLYVKDNGTSLVQEDSLRRGYDGARRGWEAMWQILIWKTVCIMTILMGTPSQDIHLKSHSLGYRVHQPVKFTESSTYFLRAFCLQNLYQCC